MTRHINVTKAAQVINDMNDNISLESPLLLLLLLLLLSESGIVVGIIVGIKFGSILGSLEITGYTV